MLKKNYSLLILFLVIWFLILPAEVTIATVRVEPARIIINALNDKPSTGMIEVVNNGEEEIELKAFLNDWSLDNKDSLVVFEPGKTDYSLNELIKFNPKEFTIAPGKKQIVRFTISTPKDDIIRERRGVVFFEREMQDIDVGTGSRVRSQIGTVIYYIPENISYTFQFLGLRVYKTSKGIPQGIALHLKNDGEAHLRYYTSYKIVDSQNKIVMEDNFEELLILPGYERQFAFYLKDRLKTGQYKFLLEFKFYNNKEVAEYQIPIKIE